MIYFYDIDFSLCLHLGVSFSSAHIPPFSCPITSSQLFRRPLTCPLSLALFHFSEHLYISKCICNFSFLNVTTNRMPSMVFLKFSLWFKLFCGKSVGTMSPITPLFFFKRSNKKKPCCCLNISSFDFQIRAAYCNY